MKTMSNFITSLGKLLQVSLKCSAKEYEKGSPEDNLEKYWKLHQKLKEKNAFVGDILQGHKRAFREFFEKHHDQILTDNSKWISELLAVFTPYQKDGTPSKRYLNLTYFYQEALKLRKKTETKAEENKADFEIEADQKKYEAINYPDRIILYIYRIFREISDDPSQLKLIDRIIKEISEELGLTTSEAPSGSLGEGIGSIMQFANGFMKDRGIEPPANVDGNQVGSLIENIVGNPDTTKMLHGFIDSIQKSKNVGEVVSSVASQLQRDDVKQHIATIGEEANKVIGTDKESGTPGTAGKGKGKEPKKKLKKEPKKEPEEIKESDDEEVPVV